MTRSDEITEDGLRRLVHKFYARVRLDPYIGPVFERAVEDWDEHLAKLTNFWSAVTLGTGRFRGNPMGAHMRLPIEPEMFDRWLSLWGETVDELFEPPASDILRAKAARIGQSLQLGVFYRPGAAAGRASGPVSA